LAYIVRVTQEHLIKSFRYRIYPTPEQEAAFRRIDGCCRLVHNWGLEARLKQIKSAPRDADGKIIGKLLDYTAQQNALPALKSEKEFLSEVPSHCLQAALRNLDNAYQRYWSGLSEEPVWRRKGEPERLRFPDKNQFSINKIEEVEPKRIPYLRAVHDWKSACGKIEKQNARRAKKGEAIESLPDAPIRPRYHRSDIVWLCAPKFGMSGKDGGAIAMTMHRPIPRNGEILSCSIRREGPYWYASFPVAIPVGEKRVQGNVLANALVQAGEMDAIHPKGTKQKAIIADRDRRKREHKEKLRKEKVYLNTKALERTRVVGIDRNIGKPVVTSLGDFLGRASLTPKLDRKLTRLQRDLARKLEALRKENKIEPGGSLKGIKFGANVMKLKRKLNALHGRIARIRKDMIHKITAYLIRVGDIFVIEDLKLQNMTASAKGTVEKPGKNVRAKSRLNRGMLDKGHGEFARQLDYKCRFANRMGGYRKAVIRVNPAYTSQMCSACGHTQSENRDDEKFLCLSCGHKAHSDENAAQNIRVRGLGHLASVVGRDLEEILSVMDSKPRPGDHRLLPPEDWAVGLPEGPGESLGKTEEKKTTGCLSELAV